MHDELRVQPVVKLRMPFHPMDQRYYGFFGDRTKDIIYDKCQLEYLAPGLANVPFGLLSSLQNAFRWSVGWLMIKVLISKLARIKSRYTLPNVGVSQVIGLQNTHSPDAANWMNLIPWDRHLAMRADLSPNPYMRKIAVSLIGLLLLSRVVFRRLKERLCEQ